MAWFVAVPSGAETIEIRSVNREYAQLNAPIVPITQGPFTIKVASPQHSLRVHANRLDLEKVGDRLAARFEVDFEGFGHLIADIEGPNNYQTHLEDRVIAPRQKVRSAADVRLVKAANGYYLTLLQSTSSTIDVVVESGLVGQVVGACRLFEVIPALGLLGCNALESALTTLRIPMPRAGTNWLIANDQLTESERRFFDRYASPL